MRKGTTLLDLPVLAFETGRRIGRVKDLITTTQQNQVVALLLDEGGLFSSAKIVPWDQIRSIGSDAVIVPALASIVSASSRPDLQPMLKSRKVIRDTRVLTESGRYVGTIHDIYLDPRSGAIQGYEVSGGFWSDTVGGRSFMPAPRTISVGEHVSFIPDEVAHEMEQQAGGVRGALEAADSTLQKVGDRAAERFNRLDERFTQGVSRFDERMTSGQIERQRNFIVGKTAYKDVRVNGQILVREGDTVTERDFEQAMEAGAVASLMVAVTAGSITGAARSVASLTPQQKRRFALGKTAQRSVSTDDGRVIVTEGQVITEPMLEHAEERGKLDEVCSAAGGDESQGVTSQLGTHLADWGSSLSRTSLAAVRGRRAGRTVTSNGTIIVAEGDRIDDDVIRRAHETGTEDDVLRAGSLGSTRDALWAAHDKTSEIWDEVRVGWQRMVASLNHAEDRQAEKIKERQIRDALGRPVTRVILDRDDNVILDVGELVTHQAVEAARRADVLDILVNSVYKGDIDLSASELRAGVPGEASLERRTAQHQLDRPRSTEPTSG